MTEFRIPNAEAAATTPRCSDAAYAEAVALIEKHVGDSDAQFALRRAVIEYGKQEAFAAIDSMTARLREEAA